MWRQRYDNEALYPYNGPVTVKRRAVRNISKKKETTVRKPLQMKLQLKVG
jgi:hypothetical protein